MWDNLFDTLNKFLERLTIALGTYLILSVSQKNTNLEKKLEIRDEVKAIKDANDKRTRDELIELLVNTEQRTK